MQGLLTGIQRTQSGMFSPRKNSNELTERLNFISNEMPLKRTLTNQCIVISVDRGILI